MIEIAGVLLLLNRDQVVLHRRSDDAPTSPGLLGLFGGHVEDGEDFLEAAQRELAEETTLDVDGLELAHAADFIQDDKVNQRQAHFNTYTTRIKTALFEVKEGVGLEVYTITEALQRTDLTHSARTTLEKVQKEI